MLNYKERYRNDNVHKDDTSENKDGIQERGTVHF